MSGVLDIENSGLLFIDYSKEIAETLADKTVLFGELRQEQWEGDLKQFPIMTNRITSMGFTEDGGSFAAPQSSTLQNGKIGRRFLDMKLELTDGIMNAARGGANSVADATVIYMERAMTDLSKYLNLHLYKDGTGVLGKISKATPASQTTNVEVDDNRSLWPNALVDVYDVTLATKRGTVTIDVQQKDLTANGYAQVVFTSALPPGTVTGDVLVGSGNLNRAIYGLDILIDDGDVHEVTVADFPTYTSLVLDNAGVLRDLTPTLFRQLGAGITAQSGSNGSLNGLSYFSDSWVSMQFEEMYQGAVRLDAGATASGAPAQTLTTSSGNIKLITDVDAKRGTIFAADMSQLTHYYQKLPAFRPVGGQVFSPSQNNLAYVATLSGISQLAIHNRNSSGRINDIRTDATIAF